MTQFLQYMGLLISAGIGTTIWFFRKGGIYNPVASTDHTTLVPEPAIVPASPVVIAPDILQWDTPKHAYHSTRVLCDNAGLTLEKTVLVDGILYMPKDIICATIMGESEFNNKALNNNKNSQGVITSVDYGICQINSRYHIGAKLDFPSVQFVLENPDKAVQFMISMYKAGQIDMWCAHKNGWYKHFLLPDSPMWKLA